MFHSFWFPTAGKADSWALAHAINALDATETQIVTHNLVAGNERMARNAAKGLRGVRKKFETDRATLGKDAARVLQEHRYARVRLTVDRNEATVEGQLVNGKRRTTHHALDQLNDALRESGVTDYLIANHRLHPASIEHAIDQLRRGGSAGTILASADSPGKARGDTARAPASAMRPARASGTACNRSRKAPTGYSCDSCIESGSHTRDETRSRKTGPNGPVLNPDTRQEHTNGWPKGHNSCGYT